VAVGVLAASCTSNAAMSSSDARAFTKRAMNRLGYPNAIVSPIVGHALYRSPDAAFRRQGPVEVWTTTATVPDGQVDLYIQRKGDSAVYVRDARTSGGRLFDDNQFRALQRFRYNPAADRQHRRERAPGAAGVALLVLAAGALIAAVLSGAGDTRQRRHARRH
jgi:hypothetical protein